MLQFPTLRHRYVLASPALLDHCLVMAGNVGKALVRRGGAWHGMGWAWQDIGWLRWAWCWFVVAGIGWAWRARQASIGGAMLGIVTTL